MAGRYPVTEALGTEGRDSVAGWGESSDIAYQSILNLILRGQVQFGERLIEKSLVQVAGVSRTPVRQALNRLAAEGVVQISRNKGAHVVSFTDEDVRSLLDVRARFESHAAGLAVERLTEEDLDRLTALAREMEELVKGKYSPFELTQLNNAFHATFIEKCGNRHLTLAIQSLVMPAMVARTYGRYTPAALQRSMHHHAELVVAARTGDAAWVESAMRTHILAARHAYDDRTREGGVDG